MSEGCSGPLETPFRPEHLGTGLPLACPDPEVPNSRPPDSRFGRETGREFPIPEISAGNRESGNGPFPDSAGNRESGSRLAANREIGDTLRCEYSWADVALSPSKCRFWPPPTFFNCQGPPMEDDDYLLYAKLNSCMQNRYSSEEDLLRRRGEARRA